MRVTDYILSCIEQLGIKDIFYLPGGGAMYFNDALAKNKNINPISCHHEQACGISAEAYGRVSPAKFGVAIVTTGPGSTNVLTPLVGAWIESLPMLIISGQVKRADLLKDRKIRQGGVQEVDVLSMIKKVTKYSVSINNLKYLNKELKKCFSLMMDDRPGPVWLEVPLDIQSQSVDYLNDDFIHQLFNHKSKKKLLKINKDKIKNILKGSRRPLFLIGHGVRISGAKDQLIKVIKKFQIPCVFTWNAFDLLEYDDQLNVGRPGVVAMRGPNFAIQNCDCLISIGSRIDNIITGYNPKNFAKYAKKIIVDIDKNELSKLEFKAEYKVNIDAKAFLEILLKIDDLVIDSKQWVRTCNSWKKRYPFFDKQKKLNNNSHYEFVDNLSRVINDDTQIITGSSGLAVEIFYTGFRNKKNQRIFLTSGLGSMGYGLAASIGACIGSEKKPTICLESDGSFMLNIQELATIRHLNLPIKIIIMNNNGYASIRNTQKNYFEERYVGTSIDSGLLIPDLCKISKSFGIPAKNINRISDLTHINDYPAPFLFNVKLSEEEVLEPKATAIPQPDGSIISMPLEDMSPLLPRKVLKKEMINPLNPASLKIKDEI